MTVEHTRPQIVVLGSINMDLVARCHLLPQAGETLIASSLAEIPGGKGANQAVAASRAGGRASMIGRVGDDGFADRLIDNLSREDVDCRSIQRTVATPSGLAMISVADSGENQIVVVPGANGFVSCGDVDRYADLIQNCDVLLLQLELPIETAVYAIRIARSAERRVILDPAPAPAQAPDGLFNVDLICPNETEAAALTGRNTATEEGLAAAARDLQQRGSKAVAITRGDQGTLLLDGETMANIAAINVTAVDATAAGDAFAGAVAVRWSETGSLVDAVHWGNAAGAIAASRPGAQPGMATRAEIIARL